MTRALPTVLLSLSLLLQPLAGQAQAQSPDALVQGVTKEVLAILARDGEALSADHRKAEALIEERIAPHFDFPRMTTLAVGQGWRQAEPAQRAALTREFRTLLVRTYANALTGYRDHSVSFKPAPGRPSAGEATVRSQISQPGAAPITVDYRLAKSDGDWKVFDLTIDNISLVTNYRSSFAAEFARGGADGLIRALQEKNRGAGRS